MAGISTAFYKDHALIGEIFPQSSSTAQNSGYIDVAKYEEIIFVLSVGAIAATGTVDAKVQQATASDGTGVKDVTGKAITQLTEDDDNKQLLIRVRAAELDVNGGFDYVRFLVTCATAASLISAQVWGCNPRYEPVSTTLIDEIVD